jgi:hypothetical protein
MTAARIVGALLTALALLPLYVILGPETGLAGAATRDMAAAYASFVFAGTLLAVAPAVLIARTGVPPRLLERAAALLLRPAPTPFALSVALIAATAAALFSTLVLHQQPNLVDAMAQLQQARYFAAGMLAAPAAEWGPFWHIQQSLITDAGWVSQYPPAHTALLALGFRAGAVWLVGPVMLGITVFVTALLAERLLPEHRVVARIGALLTAVSPFLIAHAGAYMNHTSAAAFGVSAVYCAVRAVDARAWSIAGGAALGALFATRPLSAIAAAVASVCALWLFLPHRRVLAQRAALAALGALPFLAIVASYNAHFFDSPFTFGYAAAQGPAGDLGFGVDPWGNRYGIPEALAYTSAELTSLNSALLETPLPLVVVIGAFLLFAARLERGAIVLLVWAVTPLVLHLAYWHHGIFMGPRMLNDTAPAWTLLAAVAAAGLVVRLPASLRSLPAYSPRAFALGVFIIAFTTGPLILGPLRLAAYEMKPAATADAGAGALVFVHGGWTSRLAMDLAAAGMRLDSVETALRQNPTCSVQQFVRARAGARAVTLEFERRAVGLPHQMLISPGNRVRIAPNERWSAECVREANADRNGIIDVSPLLWRGDLPGLPARDVMYARDMGPEQNAALLEKEPQRTAFVLCGRPCTPWRGASDERAARAADQLRVPTHRRGGGHGHGWHGARAGRHGLRHGRAHVALSGSARDRGDAGLRRAPRARAAQACRPLLTHRDAHVHRERGTGRDRRDAHVAAGSHDCLFRDSERPRRMGGACAARYSLYRVAARRRCAGIRLRAWHLAVPSRRHAGVAFPVAARCRRGRERYGTARPGTADDAVIARADHSERCGCGAPCPRPAPQRRGNAARALPRQTRLSEGAGRAAARARAHHGQGLHV